MNEAERQQTEDLKWKLYQVELELDRVKRQLERLESRQDSQNSRTDSRINTLLLTGWFGILYLMIIIMIVCK